MKTRIALPDRIYRLKLLVVGALLLAFGLLAGALGGWLGSTGAPRMAIALVNGLADVLLVTGSIGIAVDFFTGRERDAADEERVRRLLKESAPDFLDAVVRGFAVTPDDLKRVSTPELLDGIATNVLGIRFGDQDFASELYADMRDQAIRSPERWHDVNVSIHLSNYECAKAGAPRFKVLVKWEYTVIPAHAVQRFACVSDRGEFRELISDVPSTIPWLMTPRPGFDASSTDAFELLEYRIDGAERPIRRLSRKGGQTYSASIGEDVVRAGKPVRISYLYRTITPKSGHRLFFEVTQPTRGLSLELDYSNTDIAHLSVTDLVSSARRTQVSQMPEEVDAKIISVDLPGWLLPRAGFAFVWTLASEVPSESASDAAARPASAQDAA